MQRTFPAHFPKITQGLAILILILMLLALIAPAASGSVHSSSGSPIVKAK